MAIAVSQALPVHRDQRETKDPGDEEDIEGNQEIKATKALWDLLEKVASKASWDQQVWRVMLDSRDKKETWDLQACQELKENLVNRFQLLLLLCVLKQWRLTKVAQLCFSV